LRSSVENKGNDLRIYEYGAGFSQKPQGEDKVKLRIQSQECQFQQLEGQSHCLSFVSGYRFQLTNHPREDFNQEYVLRWVSHSLSLTHYSNAFTAFPFEVVFRPPIVTPKPKIVSTQTAIVTGPKGEEIWTDKYGRIKVQFHWDQEGQRDENSSCWIRVNQAWAGKGWGHISIPRIGQEVIISFVNGDPDLPMVTGAVYNAQQTVPYTLPGEQTKSTLKSNSSKGGSSSTNYNEIRFEDKKGEEEVYIQAEKDRNELVKNDMSTTVQHDQSVTVQHNRTKTVKNDETTTIGHDRTEKVTHNENITIDGTHAQTIKKDTTIIITEGHYKHNVNTGTAKYFVKNALTEKYGNAQTTTVEKNQTTTVKQTITIESTEADVQIKAAKAIQLQTGSSSLSMKSDGTIEIQGVKITIDGKTIESSGEKEVKMGVNAQSVTCNTSEVTTSGTKVNSTAIGEHNISGAIIKIN
jgi:type VI secretion system secreted protein VgrG